MSEVTEIIKRLRSRGLSQTEIGRRVRMHQSKVSRWEAGDVSVGADEVIRLLALERELGDMSEQSQMPSTPAVTAEQGG